MTEIVISILVAFFTGIGAFLTLVATIGVLRMPDLYTRIHAVSKSSTLGVMCVLLGCFFYLYLVEGYFNSRIIIGIVFIFITSPVAGHLISRAAYNSGVQLWDKSVQDDLKNSKREFSK